VLRGQSILLLLWLLSDVGGRVAQVLFSVCAAAVKLVSLLCVELALRLSVVRVRLWSCAVLLLSCFGVAV
jgi:hypothetical protein